MLCYVCYLLIKHVYTSFPSKMPFKSPNVRAHWDCKEWLESMPDVSLVGNVANREGNYVEEHVTLVKIMKKYLPLEDRYLRDVGVCQFKQEEAMLDWFFATPLYATVEGILSVQPNCWGFVAGNKGSGSRMHADDWGTCYSVLSCFAGVKRLIMCKKETIPAEYMNIMFPEDLDSETDVIFDKIGGVDIIILHPGELCIFQSKYPHQVTNLEDGTLGTTAILLTTNTLHLVLEDVDRMPRYGAELSWLGAVVHALYKELKLHVNLRKTNNSHLSDEDIKNMVATIRYAVETRSKITGRGKLHKQFRRYHPEKLNKFIINNKEFKYYWPKPKCT